MTLAIRRAACTSIGVAMLVVATPARPRYSIVDIGVQLGDFASFATDINNRRQVVGAIERDASPYPFLWEDGVVSELPPLSSESSGVARAINNRGQIVGDIALKHAVLWEGGAITELVTSFDLQYACSANAINNRGHIVGSCNGSPFVWEDGVLTLLPRLPGGDSAEATGINRVGTIVGSSATADGTFHAVFWRNGEIFEVARLPGSTFSMAIAINNRGQIAGMAGAQPVLWEHGSLIQLGVLREGDNGGAQGINNRGDIVGFSGSPDTSDGAVLWTRRRPR